MMGSSELDRRVTGLVGRARERAAIDGLLDRGTTRESGALVIRAEAGMGKTSLLRYAAHRARAAEMRVLSVAGVEAESDLDYSGLHSLVRPVCGLLPRLPEPQRAALAAALGLAPAAGADRFLVSAGVLSLLAAAAEDRPVLCLADDAQWLDVPSAGSLVFTARRLGAEGIVILFAAREGERRHFDGPGLDEIVLEGLDATSASELLDRNKSELAPSVRDRLLADAAGNPLALLELPACLSDAQLSGRARMPDAIPLSSRLQLAFRQQIERLPTTARSALLLAAADDGGELGGILAAAATLDLPEDALDAAERAGLIETDDARLTFRHPLIRSAVYEAATSGERRRAHGALAEACRTDEHADRRLWHLAVATLAADEEIAGRLEAAAERSRMRGGHASAATAFERAASLSETESARGRRLAEAARAAYMAGQVDRASDLVNRSLPIADRAERAHLLGMRGVIDGNAGLLPDGVRTVLEGIALSDNPSNSLKMLLEACLMATYIGDIDQLAALCRRASEFPPVTDVDRFIVILMTAGAAELEGDFERAERMAVEAIELAARLDDARCLIWASTTAGRAGTQGDGLPYANRAVRVARERALVSTVPYALQAQAAQLFGLSRFDLVYAVAEEGRSLALDIGQPWIASLNVSYLAIVDALRGDEQLVYSHNDEQQTLVASSGPTRIIANVAYAEGLLELGLGRPSEALERLLVPITTVRPQSNPVVVRAVPDAVEAATRAQQLHEVADAFKEFESWVERFPHPTRRALLARCRALIDESNAERHYVDALSLDALPPFDRARTELLYGEWLRRHRRRIDARVHLRSAVDGFDQLGVTPWAERARAELRASGETARRRDPSTRDQLTPQELHIAGLAAGGLTNPEIGAQLFLSPRTIDYHLRKVFAKLGISSRAELAAVDLGEPVAA
jgi:DNA-binding CsgD family transcriptional regulator